MAFPAIRKCLCDNSCFSIADLILSKASGTRLGQPNEGLTVVLDRHLCYRDFPWSRQKWPLPTFQETPVGAALRYLSLTATALRTIGGTRRSVSRCCHSRCSH